MNRDDKKRVIRMLLADPDVGPDILKITEKIVNEVDTGIRPKTSWWKREKRQAPVSGEKPKAEGKGGSTEESPPEKL